MSLLLLHPRITVPQPLPDLPGVTLRLQWAWLHSAPNYADNLELIGSTTVDVESSTFSEPRVYAAGNTALVSRPGDSTVLSVSIGGMSLADFENLEGRKGTVQMYRDPHGRLLHGSFNDLKGRAWTEGPVDPPLIDASFTFNAITWPDA